MKKRAFFCILALSSILSAAGPVWFISLDKGKAEAFNKRKPMLVVRYIDKEEKSEKILGSLEALDKEGNYLQDFACVKINDSALKDKYSDYPVLMLYNPEGREYTEFRQVAPANAQKFYNSAGLVQYKIKMYAGAEFKPLVIQSGFTGERGKPLHMRYTVPDRGFCLVRVYDRSGMLMKKLFSGVQKADKYTADWDLKDSTGKDAPSGGYTVIFELSSYVDSAEVTIP